MQQLIVLPDCKAIAPRRGLTARQRRELIAVLAQDGPEGLEAWLRKEAQTDPDIRRRVEEERTRLDREARAARNRLRDQHAREDKDSESAWEREMRERQERENELKQRLETLHTAPLVSREDLVRHAAQFRGQTGTPPKPGPLRSLLGLLRRWWIMLVSLWVRFIRFLRGKKAPAPRNVVILPGGTEIPLRDVMGPDAVVTLREPQRGTGWRQRARDAWNRLLGREDYAEQAQRLMDQQVAALEAEKRRERAEAERELQDRLRDLEKEDRVRNRENRQEREERIQRHSEEERRLEKEVASEPYQKLREELLGDLEESGWIDSSGNVTHRLVERFSRIVYEEARRSIPAGGRATPGTYVEGQGEYETGPLRSLHELGAMDLVQSVVRARIHHPRMRHIYDDDVRVHREVRTETTHVILVFDTSGSMEESGRLEAAKRVCLVLNRAVKDRNPDHRVDLLRMHTGIERVDLAACWQSEPTGFTNNGAALREAKRLFDMHHADRKLLYLVTDGLPEAHTLPDGTDKADRPDVCMQYALKHAAPLRRIEGLRTNIIQLETQDPMYLDAARRIADEAGGSVEAVDPADLMKWLLGDLDAPASTSP